MSQQNALRDEILSVLGDHDAVMDWSGSHAKELYAAAPEETACVNVTADSVQILAKNEGTTVEEQKLGLPTDVVKQVQPVLAEKGITRLLVVPQEDSVLNLELKKGFKAEGIETYQLSSYTKQQNDDYMAEEDTALVEARLRELGYI